MALVASSYHPHFGGVEEHVRQLARCYLDRGVPVEIWTVDRGEHLGEQIVDGVRVRYLPTPLPARRVGAMARFALAAPGAWRKWRRAYAQFRPGILHVHCFGPNGIYALRLHRATGTPLVVTSHGETLGDDGGVYQRSRLLRQQLTAAIDEAALVTAPSQYVLDDLIAHYGLTRGEVVRNGVDLSVRPDVQAPRVDDRPYILGVGRLGPMKGFDLLIDAFRESGLGRTHRLVIVGDGPMRGALRRQVEQQALSEQVRFVGRLGSQGVADAMAQAQVVVVPSRIESFGIVALEAWRSGTALIMTSRGGGPEFVRDGVDGLLVDPIDSAALAQQIRDLALDHERRDRLAAAGSRRVGSFDWAHVADAYVHLCDSVLGASADQCPSRPDSVGRSSDE